MTVAVETGVWQLDQTASTVGISHKTMWGLVNVKGTFGTLSGQGEVRGDGSAIGTVTLDAASLDTKNAKRDKHLRSADLFDTDKFPEITFAARSAELRDGDTVHVVGQLTVHGVSRPRPSPPASRTRPPRRSPWTPSSPWTVTSSASAGTNWACSAA